MKRLLITLSLIGVFQIVSAQDKTVAENELTVKVTLADTDAQNAKSLKGIEHGKLVRGESRTVFILSTDSDNKEALIAELKTLFPTCTTSVSEEKGK